MGIPYKTFKELRESLSEAVKPNDVLVKIQTNYRDPTKKGPTMMFDPKYILRALRKIVSPETKKALAGAYTDDNAIVHGKTNKTMARMELNMTLSELAKDIEKWTKANIKPMKPKGAIDRQSPTRAIIATDDKKAVQLKKSIHNARAKINVRIMKRKDGAKVYIDTDDKASLDSALKKVDTIIKK